MNYRTKFVVISNNVFGSSGPWPVSIGPQNGASDERLSDLLFEKNRAHPDYGSQSSTGVQVAIGFEGRYFTARNNILDGTGATNSYIGFYVWQRGIEPAPVGVEIYNNTIYRYDNGTNEQVGIFVRDVCTDTIIRNNLVSFPNCTGSTTMIIDDSEDGISSNNIMTNTPGLVAPNNDTPLLRNFSLQSGSPAIGQGVPVPVYDDFAGNNRPTGSYDLGAFEYCILRK